MARKIVKGRVTPLFIHPGYVTVNFMKSVDLSANANPFQTTFFATSEARIIHARTVLIEGFLEESDAEWAWFIDTDSIFGEHALPQLLRTAQLKKAKVVAGKVFILDKQNGRIFPNAFWEIENREPGQKRYKYAAMWPNNEPFEVDGTGTACLLVHREVLERVKEMNAHDPYPWQNEVIDPTTGGYEGEDLVFCQRIKAAGYEIWYDPTVEIGHEKEVVIGQRDYEAWIRKNAGNLPVST